MYHMLDNDKEFGKNKPEKKGKRSGVALILIRVLY